LLFWEGQLLYERRDWAGAEARFLRLLALRPEKRFAIVDPALRGYRARHHLGLVYRAQGRDGEAEAQWQAALAEQPQFPPACLELGKLYLARKDFTGARQVLEPAILQTLQALPLRVLLSRVLLEEGRDPLAAEQALRDVLALDPTHAEARHNLAVHLRRQGRELP
jgi:tetratricopeptide (TPR) repeat protein